MRRFGLLAVVPLLMFARSAGAQQPRPGTAGDKSNSQFDLRRNEVGDENAEAARAKARAGDCAGALALFDVAVEHSPQDPTIRRDRGLCHEKLGNLYPALDDLRAYITARPDATDGDAIRQKVNALESKTANDNEILESNGHGGTTAATEDSVDVYGREDVGKKKHERPIGPKPGEPVYLFDYYQNQERLRDRAERSALREGTGVVLGAWMTLPRVYFLGKALSGWGPAAGGSLRYSASRNWTVVLDVGWAGINSFNETLRVTSAGVQLNDATRGGPMVLFGFEARLPQTKWADDQYLLRFGLGYERSVEDDTKEFVNMGVARFDIGFRHVFADAFGFEFMFDGGPALARTESGDTKFGAVAGFTLGLDFGL